MTNEEQIREHIQNWANSVRARNVEGAVARHSPDMLMFDVPHPLQLKGIKAYRESWAGFFSWLEDGGTFELSEIQVTAGDDVAFCTAIVDCGKPPSSGMKDNLRVRLTIGLRKIEGAWVVMHEHHSEPAT